MGYINMRLVKNNITIIAILLIGAGFRLYNLGIPLYWYDELFTVLAISQDKLINLLAGDVHPPGYYLILRAWVSIFGIGEYQTRLLSVLFGVAGINIIYLIGREIGDKSIGLVAAVMLSITPGHIHYSQETRMYSMLFSLVGLMLLGVITRNTKLYGVAWVLAAYTHNYGLIYGLVLGVIGWVREFIYHPRHIDLTGYTDHNYPPGYEYRGTKYIKWGGLVGLLYIPWLGVMIGQIKGVANGYWIQPFKPGVIVETLYKIIMGYTADQAITIISMIVFSGLAVYIMVRGYQYNRLGYLAMIILFIIAILVIELIIRPIWLIRGFIPLLIPLYILASMQYNRASQHEKFILIGLYIPLLIIGLYSYYANIPGSKGGDWDPAIQIIAGNNDDSLIIHVNDNSILEFMYYYPDGNNKLLVSNCYNGLGSLTKQTRQGLGIQEITKYQIADYQGRIYIIYAETAVNTVCSQNEFKTLINSLGAEQLAIIRDDKFIYSGVWVK